MLDLGIVLDADEGVGGLGKPVILLGEGRQLKSDKKDQPTREARSKYYLAVQ